MAGHERPDEDDSEHWDDSDVDPFPLDRVQQTPPAAQLAQVLILVSTFLRDSDSIVDLQMKGRVLTRLLTRWGHLAETLNSDADFNAMCDELLQELRESDDIVPEGVRKEAASEGVEASDELGLEEFVGFSQASTRSRR